MKEPKYGDLRINYDPHYDAYMVEQYISVMDSYMWSSRYHSKEHKTLDEAKQALNKRLADKASKARPCVYYYPPDFEETT